MLNRRRFVRGAMAAAIGASVSGRGWSAILSPSLAVDRDIDAVTGDGASVTLPKAAVQELGLSLRGNLVLPGHPVYDDARRVINAQMNKFPALIVQPRGAADVKSALDFARDSNLLVAVKCGGHSPSGKSTCDGGMQIDLSLLRGVRVDPDARVAYVAGGSLLGDLDHETMARGLVTTAGTVSHTGVGGLSLGGGFGRVARRFGLALDNIRAVDIVTGQGEYLHASPEENADLYWGVRGGGGNFGVVTNFDFQLHPMQRTVVGGDILFPLAQARDVLSFFNDYAQTIPDELYADIGLVSSPGGAGDFVLIHLCYSGPEEQAARWVEPVRKAGSAVVDGIKSIDYVAIQKSWDMTDPRATGDYIKAGFVTGIGEPLIDAMLQGFEPHPGRGLQLYFQCGGGAIDRVASDATAFAHRYARYNMFAAVAWPTGTEHDEHVRYIKDYWKTIAPFTRGFYVNDISDQAQTEVNDNYQGNYARLVKVKNKYDPGNLFRLNANVTPTL